MIGGEHFLSPPHPVKNSMSDLLDSAAESVSFFATGRDALYALLGTLPHKTVHLPDLICVSVYQACLQAGKDVVTYRMNADLVQHESCDPEMASNSCLLVMHYFGVANEGLIRRAKSFGMTVISDVTHMLFNRDQIRLISAQSDYLVASLRKSGPFPDGGFLSSCHHPVTTPSSEIREEFFALRAAGLLSRGFSAKRHFNNDESFHMLRKAESLIDQSPAGDHACSYYTRELLRTISVDENAKQIIRNITTLSTLLQGSCGTVNTQLSPSPYYLCLFKNQDERDAVRSQLASDQYFCPIHWDTSALPTPSPLSVHILSIPCDSRYSETNMEAVAKAITLCLKKSKSPS
jgi:hypothetical protein